MPDTLLKVEHLKKVYESSTGSVEAIGDISFTMGTGELVCIVGPSGLRQDHAAEVHRRPAAPDRGRHRARRQGASAVRRRTWRWSSRSTAGACTRGSPCAGTSSCRSSTRSSPRAERDGLIDDALVAVGLDHAAKSYPWQLSGGMQQRVAIARAVAYQPEVLIMDEPFAAVDAQTRADLEDLVRRLHRERGMSILFVTHDIDESVYLGERVVVLSKSPTWVQEDLAIDLAPERDQITTRALPRFTELRTHVYEQIQRAKRGEAVRPTRVSDATSHAAGEGTGMRSRQPKQLLLAFFGEYVVDQDVPPLRASALIECARRRRRCRARDARDPRSDGPARASSIERRAAARSCSR